MPDVPESPAAKPGARSMLIASPTNPAKDRQAVHRINAEEAANRIASHVDGRIEPHPVAMDAVAAEDDEGQDGRMRLAGRLERPLQDGGDVGQDGRRLPDGDGPWDGVREQDP